MAAAARFELPHRLVQLRDVPVEFLTGQRLHGHDRSVRLELLVGPVPNHVLDADAAEDLHRALVDERSTGVDGGSAIALDDQRRYVVLAEKRGRGQAGQAPSDDQHRDFPVNHACPRDSRAATRLAHSYLDPIALLVSSFVQPSLRRAELAPDTRWPERALSDAASAYSPGLNLNEIATRTR
jgi:hypothetical protein